MKRSLLILICLFLFSGTCVIPTPAANENIALGKPVTGSSYYNSGHMPERVVDGNLQTLFAGGSNLLEGKINNEEFVMIDLLAVYSVSSIIVRSRRDLDQQGGRSGWKVYGSLTSDFKEYELYGAKGGAGAFMEDLNIEFSETKVFRYVRVTAASLNISEIEVFGEIYVPSAAGSYDDISDGRLKEANRLISYLDIMEGTGKTSFGVNMLVTRAESAKIVLSAINMSDTLAAVHGFYDVDSSCEYEGEIAACVRMGIISPDINYRPNDYITLMEFLCMLEKAMGYSSKIAVSGGYPLGVTVTAGGLKLLNGINADLNSALSRGNMLLILYNALKAPVADIEVVKQDAALYSPDKILLETAFKLQLYEGIVTENNVTTLFDPKNNPKNKITVGSVEYIDKTEALKELIGQKISYIVSIEESSEIVAGWGNYKNAVHKIDTHIIETVSSGRINTKIGDREKNYTYNPEKVKVLKNGVAYIDFNINSLTVKNGRLDLIDNNEDSVIDVIHIYDPSAIFLSEYVTVSDNYFKAGGTSGEVIELDSFYNITAYNQKGNSINAEGLSAGSILYIYISENKASVIIDSSSIKISGVVDEYSDKDLTINANVYEYSEYYLENADKMEALKPGLESTFFFNRENRLVWIAATDFVSAGETVGFILDAFEGDGFKKSKIKIFNESGAFEKLDFADRVTIDGALMNESQIKEIISKNPDYFNQKFTLYKKDRNGELSFLDTENYNSLTEGDSKMIKSAAEAATSAMRVNEGIYQSHYMLVPIYLTTTVFIIPSLNGKALTETVNEKDYSISTVRSEFSNGEYIIGSAYFYCEDEMGYPGFAANFREVNLSDGSGIIKDHRAPGIVVSKVTKKVGEDNENCYGITGYNIKASGEVKLTTAVDLKYAIDMRKISEDMNNPDIPSAIRPEASWFNSEGLLNAVNVDVDILSNYMVDISDIKAGDILIYQLSNNLVSALAIAFRYSDNIEPGLIYTMGSNYNSRQTSTFKLKAGTPSIIKGDVISLYITQTSNEVINYANLTGSFYVYKNGNLKNYRFGELPVYCGLNSKVLIYSENGTNKTLIAYE